MPRIQNILVPTDFGPSSKEATAFALGLAQQLGATLTLMHAWDAPAYAYSGMVAEIDPGEVFESKARAMLEDELRAVQATMPEAKSALVQRSAVEGIHEAIAQLRPDLVVMGTHGRKGLARAVLGSVAELVVRTSTVPVLTVHAPAAS